VKNNHGISYVVPAYNEEDGIGDTIKHLHSVLANLSIPYEIIVVNDGSHDKTGEIAGQFDNVILINHPVNVGYGNSLKSGIQRAHYDWIGIIDADGSYPIGEIPKLLYEMKNGFDMVIGLRDNLRQLDGPIKKIFRWLYGTILRLVVKDSIEDANSGLRVFRREMAMGLLPFLCGNFSFTTSLTILAMGKDCFVKYVPIQYSPRKGSSNVRHIRDSVQTLQYIMQGITFFNPIKFFLLLSFCMILVVCIPAMAFACFNMHTLSLYYMVFGATVTILIALGALGDIIRISLMQLHQNSAWEQDEA
jgi:polyisoprenyl-phosphate glycosyltransferase